MKNSLPKAADMRIDQQQIDKYRDDGFLIFPDLVSEAEVEILRGELDRLSAIDCSYTRRSPNGSILTLYRVHEDYGPTQSPAFRALCRLPRTLGIARQLMDTDSAYIFHTKINMKLAVEGPMWSWHQDYGGGWKFDGVPTPDIMTCLVLLDDADELGGALYVVPGSHKQGSLDAMDDSSVTAVNKYSLPRKALIDTLRAHKPVPISCKRGTVVFFHSNLIHGSGHNMSGFDRRQIYIVYNPVENQPPESARTREDHVSSKNYAAIPVEADDGIVRSAGPGRA
ncbi:MAG: phytanoyl-CoA dioxygenase family protein [Burkholderiaceae bacterium]|nr:phytanoyl-CoA dioxygenase family protein [Burkholderiaceae bacterium]